MNVSRASYFRAYRRYGYGPDVPFEERNGQRRCRGACHDWWPLDFFEVVSGVRLWRCKGCRSDRRRALEAARKERTGAAASGCGSSTGAPSGAGGAA